MKKKPTKYGIIGLIGVAVLLSSVMSCNLSLGVGFENIDIQGAYTLIQENKGRSDFIILDVRTPAEYADGHIENSLNLDYYANDFEAQLDRLDKNKTYLVYCRSANRSAHVINLMQKLGFKSAYNMLGGINEWNSKGYPTVS
ncbi:MAG: rhodanese-like domain-containing protein [Dehalococcoidales bacterium]